MASAPESLRTEGNGTSSIHDIEREIAETRRQMSRTIDEIQYRLSPDHMKSVAKERMRTMAHQTSTTMMDRIKQNPGAVAVTALGLYMMFRDRSDRHEHSWVSDGRGDVTDLYCGSCGAMYIAEVDLAPASSFTGDSEGRIRGTAQEAKDRVSNAAHNARERLSDAGDRVRRRAREARMRMSRSGRNANRRFEENPIVLGAIAIAVGAALGALIPETQREHELLGDAADRARERAAALAREKTEQAKRVARTAAEAAVDEGKAEAQRQTSGGSNEATDRFV